MLRSIIVKTGRLGKASEKKWHLGKDLVVQGLVGLCKTLACWRRRGPDHWNGDMLLLSWQSFGKLHCLSSVQFSLSVVSDSLRLHEPQHTRPPCPSPTPRVYPNSCPLSQWCHPTISSSVIPFSSCPQSFPESGSFQMSRLFASGGQSIGVSASTSVPPMNTPGLISFRMDWLDLLAVQETLKSLLQHHSSKASASASKFFGTQPSSQSNSHNHTWPLEKP